MKGTPVVLGIKGIFPLVKKHAPHCITSLPTLDALPKSSRLAIDATLLVQRLHFADDTHPSRHLLGFHRLIRQLRESSLVPIMVFDNFSQGARLPAKMRENEKRRSKRSTLALRANVEALRGNRLQILAEVLKEWKGMQDEDRSKAADLLRSWKHKEMDRRAGDSSEMSLDFDEVRNVLDLDFDVRRTRGEEEDSVYAALQGRSGKAANVEEMQDGLKLENDWIGSSAQGVSDSRVEGELSRGEEGGSDFLIGLLPHEDFRPHPSPPSVSSQDGDVWSDVQEAESSKVLYMASRVHHLRRQHDILASSFSKLPPVLDATDLDTHTVPAETPTQAQMTLAEASVYERLQAGVPDPGADMASLVGTSRAEAAASLDSQEGEMSRGEGDVELQLLVFNALTAKNVLMQRSYTRSSTMLSASIFESCAKLCSLLRVPVLWTGDGSKTGGRAHEGEALASMLVCNDLADAVVSEDSDVLLYGAPLIRGIMGQKGLEYVDSKAVRKNLFPPSSELDEEKGEAESQKQMLDFALLCGTDFNRTVPGIGPQTALKLIREYKSIDGIRLETFRRKRASRTSNAKTEETKGKKVKSKKEMTFVMPDNLRWRDYSKELNEARRVFENPPSLYWHANKLEQHKMEEPIDYDALHRFLRHHGIAPHDAVHVQPPRPSVHPAPTSTDDHHPSPPLRHNASGFGSSPFADGNGSVASWSA